jgi:hypothetical protein
MNERKPAGPAPEGRPATAAAKRSERKAVLNVTVGESLAAAVREIAAREQSTISSVVEEALARQVSWELKRLEGLAAIDEYFREHGHPTEAETAAAAAWVDEVERLLAGARDANRRQDTARQDTARQDTARQGEDVA